MENEIECRRRLRKWSKWDLARRVIWGFLSPCFRFSPRLFWGWRRFLLRAFGAKIGAGVRIYPDVKILIPWNLTLGSWVTVGSNVTLYALGEIVVGQKATISQNAHLCAGTHDYQSPTFELIKSSINIGPSVWICADSFIGPSVSVGAGAVVAARSVVIKDVEELVVVGGNPARYIKCREMKC